MSSVARLVAVKEKQRLNSEFRRSGVRNDTAVCESIAVAQLVEGGV
jgi:hypothetical protein